MAGKLNDLTGQRFGRLLVKHHLEFINHKTYWICLCDCGREVKGRSDQLLSGNTRSCGCLFVEASKKAKFKKHGLSKSPIHHIYRNIKDRCNNPKNKNYHLYGGRGIKISEHWLGENGFINFYNDMGDRPKGTSVDRINNDGNYEPGNCRWATTKQQANNRRKPNKRKALSVNRA